MTQIRTTRYHALDTSRLQNEQLAGVVRPGVYAGYRLRPNAAEPNRLDLTHGDDGRSLLVTQEGVRIEETTEQAGVVTIGNADLNLPRLDLVVAAYRFTSDNAVQQLYTTVRGRYPTTQDEEPVAPVAQDYQVVLATVLVRPQRSSGGTPRARIDISDIRHAGGGLDVLLPEGVASLKPEIEPADRRRVFVHAGLLPNFDGSALLSFPGGYSPLIDPATMTEGEVRHFLFGVSDDAEVVTIGTAATATALPPFSRDIFPVCRARGVRQSGSVVFTELVDLRLPFARQLAPSDEGETYRQALAASVFEHLRVDTFRSLDGLALDSLNQGGGVVAVALDRGVTAATFTASTEPTADVTIATQDLLTGTAISNVPHFLVLVDAECPGLLFRFSTTSPYGGFTTARHRPGTIVRVPTGGSGRLFLQFILPAAAFADGAVPRLFSFGCLMRLSETALNSATVQDVGFDAVKQAVPNLIQNGNFRHWSRDDADGNTPDPELPVEIAYPVGADRPYAADGWQFTAFNFDAHTGQVRRRGLTRDVLGAPVDNAGDTALWWEGAAGVGALAVNTLEYRAVVPPGAAGQRVTFALRHRVNALAVCSIGVALYELTPQRTLKQQGVIVKATPAALDGELLVVSDLAVNERTYAVGFLVYLQQTAGVSTAALWNARAALGEFRTLPYNEPLGAADLLRRYYERGRLFVSTSVQEGDEVGAALQFGSKKLDGLGTLEVRTIQESDSDRSLNVTQPTFEATVDGVTVTALATSGGVARVDVDFEAFIRYLAVTA